jgi:hypothetical protein
MFIMNAMPVTSGTGVVKLINAMTSQRPDRATVAPVRTIIMDWETFNCLSRDDLANMPRVRLVSADYQPSTNTCLVAVHTVAAQTVQVSA